MLSPLKTPFSALLIISGFIVYSSTKSTNKTIPCSVLEYNTFVVFDCSARNLKTVPSPIIYMSSSVELILTQNSIMSIYKPSFQNWLNLTIIDLSWNYPKTRQENPDLCKRGLEINNETFSNLTKLEQLIIGHSNLCEFPSGLPSTLTFLNVQYNNIYYIDKESVSRLKNLQQLYLGHNCYYGNKCNTSFTIGNGTFNELRKLTVLNLSFNNLTNVPPELPPSLRELYLSNNRIQIVQRDDFKNLVNLEILFLSGNCPRCYNAPYPCEPCAKMSSIQIDAYAFQNLKNLTMLNLGSTSLTFIPKTWFQNTTQLKVLNLQLNYLVDEIATGTFLSYLPSLEILDLSFNYKFRSYPKYINISENFSKLQSLRELHMQGYVFKEITSKNLSPLIKLHKLNIINFGVNFIRQVDFKLFEKLPHLTIIYLSENRISPFSESTNETKALKAFYNNQQKSIGSYFSYSVLDDRTKISPAIITPFHNLVKPQCTALGKALDLSLNSIFFIDPEEFRPFSDVVCLNLSSNGIGQDLNGTEFIYLPNLAFLDLSFNKLDFASIGAFQELKHLQVLDISYNKHYFIVEGVTHHLKFIENLYNLQILNLSWNAISTLTESQIKSHSLTELRFAGNRLDILWRKGDTRYIDIFRFFTNLSLLDISHNKLSTIPDDAISNLSKNLSNLYLNNNELAFFGWTNLKHFKNLKLLDLSHNKITMIQGYMRNYTDSLRTLIISHNMIQTLAQEFLRGLSSLSNLDLSFNNIQRINKSIFLSDNENYLKVLNLKENPFDCTCEIIDLISWINKNNVTIPRLATDVTCATPDNWKKRGIIYFDIYACNLDNIGLLLFLISLCVLIPLTTLPIMKHLFYWDVWYIYHWCAAQLKKHKKGRKLKGAYDAFIAYDETDLAVSDWVVHELCYQLEREKNILLCLEERDWEPGKAIIENIAQSINQSRKTIFVLTKRYVESGKFRTIFYLAMQKLMDENMDVIVVVLLQPVLQHSQYLRLRKRICKSSILEWPKNPYAKLFFWQQMKQVLRTENVTRYNKLYTDSIAMHT